MTKSCYTILVFDSGVGGLSIVEHIRAQHPDYRLIYLADNHLFPYGLLSEQQLVDRVTQLLTEATQRFAIDLMVIACNTASTLVLPKLRKNIKLPIVGVVPAIKPAAAQSNSKVIGLLATPGTIVRDYTDTLIGDFADDCEIVRVGSKELVDLAERKMSGRPIELSELHQVLMPFYQHPSWQQMDSIILACTHFPLLKHELQRAAPSIKFWVDSGDAIARRIGQLLTAATNKPSCTNPEEHNQAWLTQLPSTSSPLHKAFTDYGFESTKQW
jgi:glutamate racemase